MGNSRQFSIFRVLIALAIIALTIPVVSVFAYALSYAGPVLQDAEPAADFDFENAAQPAQLAEIQSSQAHWSQPANLAPTATALQQQSLPPRFHSGNGGPSFSGDVAGIGRSGSSFSPQYGTSEIAGGQRSWAAPAVRPSFASPIAGFQARLPSPGDKKLAKLVAKYRASEDEDEKADIVVEIETSLTEVYEEYLSKQNEKYLAMKSKLDKIKTQIEKREAAKEDVIKAKVQSIVDVADGIGWPETTARSPGPTPVYVPANTSPPTAPRHSFSNLNPFAKPNSQPLSRRPATQGKIRTGQSLALTTPQPTIFRQGYHVPNPQLAGLTIRLREQLTLLSQQKSFPETEDLFIQSLEPTIARKVLKEKSAAIMRNEVSQHMPIWGKLIEHVVQNPPSPDELQSAGGEENTIVFDQCLIVEAPDAKLHMVRREDQWFIDYESTVATFPDFDPDKITEPESDPFGK